MAKKNKRSSSSNEIESKKTKKAMGGVGRINSLPDSILHHVLSFLTLREAIQTSLVSKRWRNLSASIPTLNFTKGHGNKKAFMEFVDTLIILRHPSYDIQRFSISDEKDDSSSSSSSSSSESDSESEFSKEDDSDTDSNSYDFDPPSKKIILRLNYWIRSAIIHNLKEIHLEICFGESVEFPHCLFTCKSLKKLELFSLDQKRSELILPADSISLPQLQTLHLDRLTLHHEDDFKINVFPSNCCPSLESLTLYECGFHQKNLNINAPKLKHFVINENLSEKQFMEHGGATGSVRLYAPNLISFHCKDYLSKSYCLDENLSSLVEAHIDMKVRAQEKLNAKILEYGRHVAMISGEKMINYGILHNVKHLKLSAWALQIFLATYESPDSASTEFHNLRSLKLQTWLSWYCIRGITHLLHISPNIVKLSLEIIKDTVTPVFSHWDEIDLNPSDIGDYLNLPLHCMLDHLKFVEIRGLEGTVNELKFLEILLKNAVVLKELIVGFSPDYLKDKCFRKKKLAKYSRNLQSFPRASSSCIFLATYESPDSASTEFHNLRSLKLQTWLSWYCIRGITHLLHISPNIVKLSLEIIKDMVTPVFPHWDEINVNPSDIEDYLILPLHCMLDHLKYIDIRGLMGTVNELKFLEVLLKNAVVLEELIVGFSPGKDFGERQLIKYNKILQSFPRASSSVSILFIS